MKFMCAPSAPLLSGRAKQIPSSVCRWEIVCVSMQQRLHTNRLLSNLGSPALSSRRYAAGTKADILQFFYIGEFQIYHTGPRFTGKAWQANNSKWKKQR